MEIEPKKYKEVMITLDDPTVSQEAVDKLKSYVKMFMKNFTVGYDPEFGDMKICVCSHHYYRHFDGYDDNRAVGCKYCQCNTFELADIQ